MLGEVRVGPLFTETCSFYSWIRSRLERIYERVCPLSIGMKETGDEVESFKSLLITSENDILLLDVNMRDLDGKDEKF